MVTLGLTSNGKEWPYLCSLPAATAYDSVFALRLTWPAWSWTDISLGSVCERQRESERQS